MVPEEGVEPTRGVNPIPTASGRVGQSLRKLLVPEEGVEPTRGVNPTGF